MRRESKRLAIGFGAAIACWYAFVFFLPRLDHCTAARLPRHVLSLLWHHAREVCAGQAEFGSKDSALLKRIAELRVQENNYLVVHFPASKGTTAAIVAYPRKKQAYLYSFVARIAIMDWELQSQYSYVLTASGELYNSTEFDVRNPVTEDRLPTNQPQAWHFMQLMPMLPPCK